MRLSMDEAEASAYLTTVADKLRLGLAACTRLHKKLVEYDIAMMREEADVGLACALERDAIQEALEVLSISEETWTKDQFGCSIQQMRRRTRLAKNFDLYVSRRREKGTNGEYGLTYALFLISDATNAHPMSVRSGEG